MTGRHDNPGGGIGRKGCLDYNLGQDVSSERINPGGGIGRKGPGPCLDYNLGQDVSSERIKERSRSSELVAEA